MELIKPDININIVGKMKIAVICSLALIIVSILSLILHGGPRLGIDFAGGTLVQIQFQEETSADSIRDGLKKINLGSSAIQQFGYKDNNEFLIRTEKSTSDLKGLSGEIEEALTA
ncbi:MAG: protein translocase subunit SecF, partial [Proteobacteria bacterium]|nr:protein translocase subunit SecF [Pseudomonadota bacterium]